MPPQVAPVRRPEVIAPHSVVDVEHGRGEDLVSLRIMLLHGANFNDPCHFAAPSWDGWKLR